MGKNNLFAQLYYTLLYFVSKTFVYYINLFLSMFNFIQSNRYCHGEETQLTGFWGLWGSRVDAIDHYTDEIAKLSEELAAQRWNGLRSLAYGTACGHVLASAELQAFFYFVPRPLFLGVHWYPNSGINCIIGHIKVPIAIGGPGLAPGCRFRRDIRTGGLPNKHCVVIVLFFFPKDFAKVFISTFDRSPGGEEDRSPISDARCVLVLELEFEARCDDRCALL
ncbi:2,3-bisphosphoglycerate-independent phosphoglycerate mutase [Quercus suber]|uniref:2,3-bisphosphoglycerate-independent phosphoglycerate mutase n=1 Tax=Quercus suber TaxID=58331 RepID=A0AAW0JHX0_QUESU